MKNRSGEKIKLASIDELLGVVNEESAMEIEISKIHPFKNHPFKVLDDEKMQDVLHLLRVVRHDGRRPGRQHDVGAVVGADEIRDAVDEGRG